MGGMNSVRNKKIDKYVKEGMTEDEAIMRADKESQVRTEKQNPRTKKLLNEEAGTNAADIEKTMDKNVMTTAEENDFSKLKSQIGSKKRFPSWLELLMYGKNWYNEIGKYRPKEKD